MPRFQVGDVVIDQKTGNRARITEVNPDAWRTGGLVYRIEYLLPRSGWRLERELESLPTEEGP